jgi:hypothetical protein
MSKKIGFPASIGLLLLLFPAHITYAEPCISFDHSQVTYHPDEDNETIFIYKKLDRGSQGPEIGHIELACDVAAIEKRVADEQDKALPFPIATLMVRALISHKRELDGLTHVCEGEALTIQNYALTKTETCPIKRITVK